MISRSLYWRSFVKDRIFVFLFTLTMLSLCIALLERQPSFERTPIPFNLGLSFALVNIAFAIISLRREPLLSYMFLTLTILLNGTLYFFFRYLITIQMG